MDLIEDYITENTNGNYVKSKGVNSPKLVTGMTKIMFKDPTETSKGEVVKAADSNFDNSNWYDYTASKWANAMTEDGSMWVWIPRYAYKITYKDSSNKSQGGTIDVKFLIGTSDQYYDEKGELQTAQRAKSATEIVDTTIDFYVHPAFTNETSIGYANGGWDKELTGIWVAKFEAGYASGNNTAEVKPSSVNYSQKDGWIANIEAGTQNSDGGAGLAVRNWLDGEYGVKNGNNWEWKNGTPPAIKYPTFQPTTYSMNYINHNDAYNISKALTESGNVYGFSSSSTDSHLMKNSEWGAISYLGHSPYGLNGAEVYINNITLNNSTQSVYAVTGVTTGTTSGGTKKTTIENINRTTGNAASDEVYTWDQYTGQKASCTGNMYGIYDLSGGLWDRIAGYVANENDNLKKFGNSIAYDGDILRTTSTKYTTVYPHDSGNDNPSISSTDTNLNVASSANYPMNKYIFGDAIRETSTSGTGDTSWNNDCSYFPAWYGPFAVRGGRWNGGSGAGLFYFNRTDGNSSYSNGFRPVLVCV